MKSCSLVSSLSLVIPFADCTPREDAPCYCETTLGCADGWECIDHSCAILVNTGAANGATWYDEPCTLTKPYICEK